MRGLIRKSGLTTRELLIILFLLIAFAAGLIIRYSAWQKPADYDYSSSDKKFEEQVKSAFGDLEKDKLSIEQERKKTEIERFSDSLIAGKDSSAENKTLLKPGTKININSAYAADLQLLPGIGEVIAERIIEYREQKGVFKRADDIKKIKGIGDKKFEKIKDYITVE
jgi:comEA protein